MLYRSLKPKGILVSNEYVGPKYQQIGPRQQEIINAIVHLLPTALRDTMPAVSRSDKLKRRLVGIEAQEVFGQVWRPTPMSYFLNVDPSECVASDRIIPILTETFDSLEVKYFGGSILFYALGANFYDRFDFQNKHHRDLVEILFKIEDAMIEAGEIGADNAHIIAWKD